ncbi:MAG: hypothetical protein MJK14_24215, partial [Rivularia sp. ALOHA_DT_140]|nr:hypothetical protein [Rivularia sp. ALOHA_DT_140]
MINPSGIVFGENAALNIGGSFFATTADSIVFPDNIEFSATNTDEPPLLSINVPLGIQFGSNAATITNRSQTIDSDPTSPVGLQVKPGKSITLLGGKIEFDNGQLTASGGRVNLGAVAPDSFVSIASGDFGWILGYDKANNFEDITLRANTLWANDLRDGNFFSDFDAEVDTSGERGGDIDVRGRQILFDGVSLLTGAQGLDAGKITINSSESLKFDSISEEKYIFLVAVTFGLGNAGDIQINSPNIHIKSFTNIISSSGSARLAISGDSNQGNAGNITINTDKFINEEGGIVSDSYGVGDGGNVTLIAKEVILDGSKFDSRPIISSTNVGSANPGNIIITAERVSVNQGTIFASGFGAKPGEINMNVRNLELTNQALIINEFNTSILNPEFKESSGNITINASESVSISGHEIIPYPEYESLFASGLSSTNNTLATGNIVDNTVTIKVTTGHLKIFDGGEIVADTNATGNAGNIVIDANRIDISGSVTGGFGKKRAGIQTTANSEATGNAGNIDIRTDNLRVFDGGSIASNALGISGNAGSISINAGNIDLEGVLSEQQLP